MSVIGNLGAGRESAWPWRRPGPRSIPPASARRADERRYQERQTLLDREEGAAAGFQKDLADMLGDLPKVAGRASEIAAALARAHAGLLSARTRAAVVANEEVERRFRALDMALFIQAQYADRQAQRAERGPDVPPDLNPWPLDVAANELMQALVALQRREPPPPPVFPTSTEVVQLSFDAQHGDRGLTEVARVVRERDRVRRRDAASSS